MPADKFENVSWLKLSVLIFIGSLQAQERLSVEIAIFSGRPNPVLLLETTYPTGNDNHDNVAAIDSTIVRDEHEIMSLIRNICSGTNLSIPERKLDFTFNLGYQGLNLLRQTGQATYQSVALIYSRRIRLSKENGYLLCGDAAKTMAEDVYYYDANSELEKRLIRLAIKKNVIQKRTFAMLARRHADWIDTVLPQRNNK